ncbi:hypothetical protein [Pseudomonas saliphila]|uniref:hypothetical protein n=1 Tax=Pseudomonas saliphila TaxID=2586906 RepID=UPI001238CB3A|nr:hypothetical protein [Pseudomonas saliphila]
MATAEGNNNVAIVAIIVVGVLIAGAGVLYYTGALGNKSSTSNTTVIEAPAAPKEATGISLKFEDKDGTKTEIQAP